MSEITHNTEEEEVVISAHGEVRLEDDEEKSSENEENDTVEILVKTVTKLSRSVNKMAVSNKLAVNTRTARMAEVVGYPTIAHGFQNLWEGIRRSAIQKNLEHYVLLSKKNLDQNDYGFSYI